MEKCVKNRLEAADTALALTICQGHSQHPLWLDPSCQVTVANHLWASGWNALAECPAWLTSITDPLHTSAQLSHLSAKRMRRRACVPGIEKKDHNAWMNLLAHHWWKNIR